MRIATRGSALALWQANYVMARLEAIGVENPVIQVVETAGDRDTSSPLHSIGGKGVFCKEVQLAVLDGRADVGVHSAKDLPALTPPGLVLGAIPTRDDPEDCLVGSRLLDLATGGRVATGSVRRRAQLARLRPDLEFHELRGNISTRLAKAHDFDAIMVAHVALKRLAMLAGGGVDGLTVQGLPVDVLPPETMIPQVGQGALAIECRHDDQGALNALAAIDDPTARRLVRAERAFLRELGGDCFLPAGAYATGGPTGSIELVGFLASPRLDRIKQLRSRGDQGEALGRQVAKTLRAAISR